MAAAWPPAATPSELPRQPAIAGDVSRAFEARALGARAEIHSARTAPIFPNDPAAQPGGDEAQATETREPGRSATFPAPVLAGTTTSATAGSGAAPAFDPSAAFQPINAEAGPVTTLNMPTGRDITAHHMVPVSRPEMPAQIPTQISHALVSASGPVTELRLSPDELGTIRIELKTDREKVTVTLLAERPETLDLLRRHSDRLVAEFRAAGFSEMSLGFGNLAAGEQSNSQAGPGTAGHEAPETPPLSADISASRAPDIAELRLAPQTSLYLRL
ncbi:flagellar hook-length control protein FliK [Pseudogemmobacter bohemicus]|uniref:flagellar hook-length control protein FliK n=1 Tax=Pseudogemmobacter bohemicus TaxID=2250708 RepID=UPI0013006D9B|nr:flagellar hook-length control protein FliK [Pseudogemmobacter bohemicus]